MQRNESVYYVAIAALLTVAVAAGGYLLFKKDQPEDFAQALPIPQPALEQQETLPEPEPESEPEPTPEPTLTPEPEPETTVVEQTPVVVPPLFDDVPELDAGHAWLLTQLPKLADQDLSQWLGADYLVRKAVVFVENLSRGQLVLASSPFKPFAKAFAVKAAGEQQVADLANFSRVSGYIAAFKAVDKQKLAAFVKHTTPLTQQALAEIGVDTPFTTLLVQAIDQLLATPEPKQQLAMYSDAVMYKYQDEQWEQLPSAQKWLIRTGPLNMREIKKQLQAFKTALQAN